MDRSFAYPGAIPLDTDLLNVQQRVMIALGFLIQAVLNNNETLITGLACSPTAPASMGVQIAPGSIIAPQTVEVTPFGVLPVDDDALVKMGINLKPVSFPVTAPAVAGQSQNYLIQAAFEESDGTPVVLPYYNSSNPSQPYTGPGNSGTAQNTVRAQTVNLELKAGAPANAGQQVTPAPDSGFIGLWVITVNAGQVQVTAGSIAAYGSAPMLAGLLQSHHNGQPGQAPKVILTNGQEVQGILPTANGGTGASSGFNRYARTVPTGASNISLSPGDWQTVSFSSQSTVPLGLNTADGQVYRLTIIVTDGSSVYNNLNFLPNDTTYGASAFTMWYMEPTDAGATAAPFLAQSPATLVYNSSSFMIDLFDGPSSTDTVNERGPFIIEMTVSTKTVAKNLRATSGTAGGGAAMFGSWTDTTTPWSTLGTLQLVAGGQFSGVTVIERLS